MNPQTKITIDMLTNTSVSIKSETIVVFNGQELALGDPHRTSYLNSILGRKDIKINLAEPFLSSVIAVWGDTPLVEDYIPDNDNINGSNDYMKNNLNGDNENGKTN